MSRRAIYRTAKGAFFYVYLYLFFLISFGIIAVFQRDSKLTIILVYLGFNLMISLWTKRAVIHDLITGQTKIFHGEIACQEIANNLKCNHVAYLVEKTERNPRKFVLFSDALPLSMEMKKGILSETVTFQYLPHSLIIVQIEQIESLHSDKKPQHRTKAWYQAKQQAEHELQALSQPKWCKFHESFGFWEELPTFIIIALVGICLVGKAIKYLWLLVYY